MNIQRTPSSKKLLILGLGLVGKSLLSLVLHERLFRMDIILAVDASEDAFGLFDRLLQSARGENRYAVPNADKPLPDRLREEQEGAKPDVGLTG
ncbi:MAG: hypothetical protein IJU66_04370 [Oscillospiraceae bacterium]|nr:hypothetical protein [Oscillospiraceae bacterium]